MRALRGIGGSICRMFMRYQRANCARRYLIGRIPVSEKRGSIIELLPARNILRRVVSCSSNLASWLRFSSSTNWSTAAGHLAAFAGSELHLRSSSSLSCCWHSVLCTRNSYCNHVVRPHMSCGTQHPVSSRIIIGQALRMDDPKSWGARILSWSHWLASQLLWVRQRLSVSPLAIRMQAILWVLTARNTAIYIRCTPPFRTKKIYVVGIDTWCICVESQSKRSDRSE